ncbi:MAG: ABC transporter ATP-binding protein [Pseudomonadota bacterium]
MNVGLEGVGYRRGSENWIYPLNLRLQRGAPNVLLGTTGAGKTTLLRLMAGLDVPTAGRVLVGDRDVTGVAVRRRSVAMVYQQFINYPSLTVFENIASPLRVARRREADIHKRVGEIAEVLRLSPLLERLPSELSGGQQQRTALARALARDAELLLLDEPLANLDYKLREELREELAQLFARQNTTVVYATTDPLEALQLGGHTTVLDEGRLLQSGATIDVFRRPISLATARAFSDPPLNVLPAVWDAPAMKLRLDAGPVMRLPSAAQQLLGGETRVVQLGMRPLQLRLSAGSDQCCALPGVVELAEISGSDTYLHLRHGQTLLVAQIPGVHPLPLGSAWTLYVDPALVYGFSAGGDSLFAPEH